MVTPAGASPAPRPASRGRRRWLLLVGVVVVAVVLIVLGLAFFAMTKATVTVSSLRVVSTDGTCGVTNTTLVGFTTQEEGSVPELLTIHNPDPSENCTIRSVTTPTAGFSVYDPDVPLTIEPRSNGTLSFTIIAPKQAYSGPLTLDIE
jgi:hypothetical protein